MAPSLRRPATGAVRRASGVTEGGDSRALHARRRLTGDHERGRRCDPVDVRARRRGETLSGHATASPRWSSPPDGRTLYTAGLDGSILLWDLTGTRGLGRPFEAGGAAAARSAERRGSGCDRPAGRSGQRHRLRATPRGAASSRWSRGQAIGGIRFLPGSGCWSSARTRYEGSSTPTAAASCARSTRRAAADRSTPVSAPTAGCSRRQAVPAPPSKRTVEAPRRPPAGPVRLDYEIFDVQLGPDGRELARRAWSNAGSTTGGSSMDVARAAASAACRSPPPPPSPASAPTGLSRARQSLRRVARVRPRRSSP